MSGNSNGLYNNSGTVGNISNSGTINANLGVNNNLGSIGTLTNTGIVSSRYGVYNFIGTIGSILNTGSGATISTSQTGIYNLVGTIGGINNSGKISATSTGYAIFNDVGFMGSIINSGTLSGGSSGYALNNEAGTIGTGATAIDSTGTIIGGIQNSGTISGNINVNQNLIIGGAGGQLTGGTITTNNHDLTFDATASQLLADNINVGASNTVSVAGTLEVDTTATITGNYRQSPGGTFASGISSSSNYGILTISGNASMANSTITLVNLGTTYTNGESFTIAEVGGAADYSSLTGIAGHGFAVALSSISSGGFEDLVATLNPCSQNISSSTTFSGNACVLNWSGGNLSITSSGRLFGNTTAIFVDSISSVGALTNDGTIISTADVILNLGTITTVTNDSGGTISGRYGIRNEGIIGSIVNNVGGVFNTSATAIVNTTNASIGAITNNGLIANSGTINNGNLISNQDNGIIGTFTNNGTINGNYDDFLNQSSIDTIINHGLLAAGSTAIYNSGGATINALINTGTVTGSNGGFRAAIVNYGTIGLINNSGFIGGGDAIVSFGTIGSIINSGTISGPNAGISGNMIGTISNTGLIESSSGDGIGSSGTILSINNSGTIVSYVQPTGTTAGLGNSGTIGALTNSGLIAGVNAIHSSGTILSAISNSGTIAGNITAVQNLTITGGSAGTLGTLTGYGGSIGTITATNLVFDSGAHQLLDDDVAVGSGTGTVTNNGELQVNTLHTITGNYTQASSASLLIGVTNSTTYGELSITGIATMTTDVISIAALSGSLTNGETFTIVQATNGGTDYSGITASAGGGFTASVTSSIVGGFDDLIISLATIVSCQTVSSNTTISGSVACVNWTGANLSIAGAGTISGATTAVRNSGSNVGTLTNSGTVQGSLYGIYNASLGTIASISNIGTINSSGPGIYNDQGMIGAITNSGTLIGYYQGIYNDGSVGSIGTIINTGSIQGYDGAIVNNTTIGTINNSGVLSGYYGIENNSGASIASLINSGTISDNTGINNGGSIGTLTNSGTLGSVVGFNNYAGTIAQLVNTGLITGATGIGNAPGSIGTINNSGTISGYAYAINNSGTISEILNNSNGSISSGATGIYNGATINVLTNDGLISGNAAISQQGFMGT